jgi:hypothetical protein
MEEHLHYARWLLALEELVAAKADYKDAERRSPSQAAMAMRRLERALTAYHAVAIEIIDE